ncbi:hypothetical protein GCM10010156_34170 [Planobispora rosea]|uniref:Uncharacterized protein n=1 Tax=Planobispora rosea TaxID=35762 RepID=A0A8J3S3H5_PLARO|nr:hypothetical protein GCM10010156_34170 [Planobispora rosea]GIH85281.1 hypothetical protein Pro02_36890 [Planobispora rosea]
MSPFRVREELVSEGPGHAQRKRRGGLPDGHGFPWNGFPDGADALRRFPLYRPGTGPRRRRIEKKWDATHIADMRLRLGGAVPGAQTVFRRHDAPGHHGCAPRTNVPSGRDVRQ